MVCPSPERNYVRLGIGHPDHRAVGSAALDAVYPDARNPFAFPELLADEGLDAWIVPEVWISGGGTPTHYVDVTQTFPQKIAALEAHVSQVGQRDGPRGLPARAPGAGRRPRPDCPRATWPRGSRSSRSGKPPDKC